MANRSGRMRAALFLVVSAFSATVAVGLIYRLIDSYRDELARVSQPPETIRVVVAKATLFQGEPVTEDKVELRDFKPEFVPDTVFHSLEEVIGRVPKERILPDEYIRIERLASPDAGVNLQALIPTGQRAMSLNIFDASSVSGFINPGNYVDILATIQPQPGKGGLRGEPTTVTMLQAQKVLAVNDRLNESERSNTRDGQPHAPSVTLALTPEDSERLAHAYATGAITLTLRNDVDVTHISSNGTRARDLLGSAPIVEFREVRPTRAEKPLVDPRIIRMIRGANVTDEVIPK